MSYLHPSAPTNSAGEERDPITGSRLTRANDYFDRYFNRENPKRDQSPFSSWKRFSEDVLHYQRFDSLPQEQQDAIRVRRRRNFQESDIPWIVTDATSLLTFLDDIDDLKKTGTFLNEFALTPAAKAAGKLLDGKSPFRDQRLTGWANDCDLKVPPRQRKQAIPGFGGLNLLAFLGLGALGLMFPGWRFFSLALQAAQTMDNFFGIGLQLGPILGYFMETFFRGAADTGGPILQFENKWEQLKASRIIQRGNRGLAAAPHADPDDALTSLTGLYDASGSDILPRLVIAPEDYPSFNDLSLDPASWGKESFDLARLAASLPYNLGAAAVNNLLGETLANWSEAVGGSLPGGAPDAKPDNETEVLMMLAELGICPAGQCEAELLVDAMLLAQPDQRYDEDTGILVTLRDLARRLGLSAQDPLPAEPIGQTPLPK